MSFSKNSGSPEDFMSNMEEWKNVTWGTINNVMKGLSTALFQAVVRDTPVEYGWTQNSWFFSLNGMSHEKLDQYDKDGKKKVYDQSLTGAVKQKKIYNEINRSKALLVKGIPTREYFLTNNAYPANLIEYEGWSRTKAPGGMVRVNIAKFANKEVSQYAKYKPGDEG